MKHLILLTLIVGAYTWFAGSEKADVPSVSYTAVSEPLRLDFSVNKINSSGVELNLKNADRANHLFLQFGVAMKDGKPVVTLTGAGNRSQHSGAAPKKESLPNWPFLKSKDGSSVVEFSFENQLVQDEKGNQFVRMAYVGAPVPLISTLVIERPATMPPIVTEAFGVSGPIQFVPGTYQLDEKLKGFAVPVRVLGR